MDIEAWLVIGASVCALGISLWQFMVAVVMKDIAVEGADAKQEDKDSKEEA